MIAIENAQLLAIEGVLTNSLESFERRVRRWFSKEHATAYLDTFKLPWDEILLHYYESNLANKSYNDVFDLAVDEYLPEFVQAAEEQDQAYADALIEEQKASLKKNRAKMAQDDTTNKKVPVKPSNEAKNGNKAQSIKNNRQTEDKPTPKTMSLKFDESEDI